MALPNTHRFRDFYLTVYNPSVGATPVASYVTSPYRGVLMDITATTQLAITVADSVCAFALNGSANTAGNITIPVAGAAAGQSVIQVPTATIAITDGDVLKVTPSGASGSNIPCVFVFRIRDTA